MREHEEAIQNDEEKKKDMINSCTELLCISTTYCLLFKQNWHLRKKGFNCICRCGLHPSTRLARLNIYLPWIPTIPKRTTNTHHLL